MFDYPLKKREIFIFMRNEDKLHELEGALNCLIEEASIYRIGPFYSLFNNYALAERRIRGNEKAELMLKKAAQSAALIASFPFVKGVAVSGSLSKRFADEDADIDFFIITTANRLWLARTFLHVFKKITFVFNKQDLYCMNYFIDEAEPAILEKNIYTATEIATIIPLWGSGIFEMFYKVNSWTKKYFPNKYMHISISKEIKKSWLRIVTEKLLDNKMGNLLDTFLMNLTASSWNIKTRRQKKNSKGIVMSMHTGKHFSKPNPANFQKKILLRYEKNLAEVFDQYERSSLLKNKSL